MELQLPGQDSPTTVPVDSDGLSVNAYYKSAGPEQGNVAFFLARATITDLTNP